MAKSKASQKQQGQKSNEILVAENRKARHEYEVLERFEAGIVLRGTEVKVLRQGQISLNEAYAKFFGEELWLMSANIPEYSHGNLQNHEPKRKRKLLLKKQELRKLKEKVSTQGMTLIPLRVYFGEKGYAKATVGVCRGRKTQDKRQSLREKEAKKEMRQV